MPHRVLRAVLLDQVSKCCSPQDAERVVDGLMALGIRLPTITVTDVDGLDQIPNGAAVIVGNLQDPDAPATVGRKCEHSIIFTGEDEPYPFHLPGLAPPLPCTVVWMPDEMVTQMYAEQETR